MVLVVIILPDDGFRDGPVCGHVVTIESDPSRIKSRPVNFEDSDCNAQQTQLTSKFVFNEQMLCVDGCFDGW